MNAFLRRLKSGGLPPWALLQGVAFAWIGTAGASEATREKLFWAGFALIAVTVPFDIWWYRASKSEVAVAATAA
jgi:hypothetical protein